MSEDLRVMVDPEALRRADRAQVAYRRARIALAALVVVFVAVVGAVLIVLSLQTRDLAADVESCITPGGDCYDRGVQRGEEVAEMHEQILEVLCTGNTAPACTRHSPP